MTKLPEHFPTDKLNTIERMQLEWFYGRYTEEYYPDYLFGHFMMAAYASVPAYLSPDLLYKMWQNFGQYQWQGKQENIHHIAVNDVLLSPFCYEISYEVFRMNENTRLSFLKWMSSEDPLWKERMGTSLSEIAEFIKNYHDRPSDTVVKQGAKYREDQLLEVKVYQDPEEAISTYLEKLIKAKQHNNEQELVDTINSINKATTKEAYTRYSKEQIFGNLFNELDLDLWRHAIQQNLGAFTNLLKEKNNSKWNSLKFLRKDESSHLIQISRTEEQTAEQLDALVTAQNYAVIVACSDDDKSNCMLFRRTMAMFEDSGGWNIELIDNRMEKEAFLIRLQEKFKIITQADNVLIYLSASEAVSLSSGECEVNYFGSKITDSEFNKIFSTGNPAAFTLVLDCYHSGTSHWLNTNKPGYAVFASASGNGKNGQGTSKELSRNSFTPVLCEALRQKNGKIFNRQLFSETAMHVNWNIDNDPVLLSNPATYYMQFGFANMHQTRICHLLRLCGYLHNPENADGEEQMAAALQKFSEENKTGNDSLEIGKALEKLLQSNREAQKPILLFVSSGGNVNNAQYYVEPLAMNLKHSWLQNFIETKAFQFKTLKEVSDFIKSPATRNRIQLFYFCGSSDMHFPQFPDGPLDLKVWAEWLCYQDNMEMVILNYASSDYLARKIVQIGAGMSVGCKNALTETEQWTFGERLIKTIAERKNLSELTMQYIAP